MKKLNLKEILICVVLGAVMYVLKAFMALFPNIHLVGVMIVAITVCYRNKALYSIYVYVFLEGLFSGFSLWWIPNLYTWAILWGVVMILPKSMSKNKARIVYMLVCSIHGFLYGTIYAPAQAIIAGLTFEGTIAWIIAGLSFDLIHGVSNFFCGTLIQPIITVLKHKHTN